MLFSGEEGLKPTDALSGGETARLLFCRIMLQKPNVLVLDEPTNHLDLESINALNIALQKFEGTVLLVTHDQDLMEEVGTRVWHFDDGAHRRLQGHATRSTKRRWCRASESGSGTGACRTGDSGLGRALDEFPMISGSRIPAASVPSPNPDHVSSVS